MTRSAGCTLSDHKLKMF